MSTTIAITVDARGQSCPGPLVSLAKALRDRRRRPLELLATDPGSRSDVPSWAGISGNELLGSHECDGGFRSSSGRSDVATTEKGVRDGRRAPTYAELLTRVEALEAAQPGAVKKTNKLTIIAWGGDLDRIWPTTILATTAAASGMESTVFFTFWGLFAIVKPDVRITGDNWMQKMMSAMNPGSAQKAKLSPYHFAGRATMPRSSPAIAGSPTPRS